MDFEVDKPFHREPTMISDQATIRSAVSGDAAALADLGARTFRATYAGQMSASSLEEFVRTQFGPDQQAAELVDPACQVLVAEHDRTLIGYALLRACTPPSVAAAGATMQLARLYVERLAQSRGVGTALLTGAVGATRASGHDRMWLTVWEHNDRAIAVYRRWGFTDVGGVTFDLAGELQTDRVLVLRVPPVPPPSCPSGRSSGSHRPMSD